MMTSYPLEIVYFKPIPSKDESFFYSISGRWSFLFYLTPLVIDHKSYKLYVYFGGGCWFEGYFLYISHIPSFELSLLP